MVRYVKPSFEILAMTSVQPMAGKERPLSLDDWASVQWKYRMPQELIEAAGRTCYKSEENMGMPYCKQCRVPTVHVGNCTDDERECPKCKKNTYKGDLETCAFVEMIVRRGHMSVIEHVNVTVKFISNRGFTHELVRHRLASYSQESTRFCDYSKGKHGNELTVIDQRMIILEEMVKKIYDPAYGAKHMSIDEQIKSFKNWLVEYGVRKIADEGWVNALTGEPDRILNDAFRAIDYWEQAMIEAEDKYIRMRDANAKPQIARGVLPIDVKTEIVMTCNIREWGHVFRMRSSYNPGAHPNMHQLMDPLLEDFKALFPGVYDNLEAF
jgi:thymidylate synthase (FAD)